MAILPKKNTGPAKFRQTDFDWLAQHRFRYGLLRMVRRSSAFAPESNDLCEVSSPHLNLIMHAFTLPLTALHTEPYP